MIRSIRRRFIRIALGVLALAMVLVAGIINTANWANVMGELKSTMNALTEDGGQSLRRSLPSRHMRNTLDESRYFTVLLGKSGNWKLGDVSHMADADEEELSRVAQKALDSGRQEGFCEDYLYSLTARRGGTAAVFLNCETKLTRVRRLALISLAACGGCILLAWGLVALFSSRAIRPMVENAVMQKQFITDAGHELKTPLTVISANMDVLAMESGDNEWIRSTKKQVADMRGLVSELIYLSRLDEEAAPLKFEDLDLSALVSETAEPFSAMAEFSGKAMECAVPDGVRASGDAAALKRLVSTLCDNAVKYTPEGGSIALRLSRGRKGIVLKAENSLAAPLSPEALSHLFDRFYRADSSRSRESGGYGIGLSVAKAIAEKHGGTLKATQSEDGKRIAFICTLPTGRAKGA